MLLPMYHGNKITTIGQTTFLDQASYYPSKELAFAWFPGAILLLITIATCVQELLGSMGAG